MRPPWPWRPRCRRSPSRPSRSRRSVRRLVGAAAGCQGGPPMAEPVLELRGLSYRYPEASAPALAGVDLRVERGEFVLLVGRSGSGKSTLLQAACGLVPHYQGGEVEGELAVAGLDVREHGPAELAAAVGYLAQDPEAQVTSTTPRAEIGLPLELRGVPAGAPARAPAGGAPPP